MSKVVTEFFALFLEEGDRMNYNKTVYSSKTNLKDIGFCEHSHFLEAPKAPKKHNTNCLTKREK